MTKPKPISKILGTCVGNWKIINLIGYNEVGARKFAIFRVKCTNCDAEYIKSAQQLKRNSKWCIQCVAENKKQTFKKPKEKNWLPDDDEFILHKAPKSLEKEPCDPTIAWLAQNKIRKMKESER